MELPDICGLALPQPHETHIWQLYLPTVKDQVASWATWLSQDEHDRAQRFLRSVDRDRFILSRGGLRYLLARYLDCSPQSLTFEYGRYGKPDLVQPVRDVKFNLAHSGAWVIYGVSRCQWIGVDVETVTQRSHLAALIKRCLTSEEQAALPQSAAERLTHFFYYWTIKEAYLKAIGLGLSYPMSKVQVALHPVPHLKLFAQPAAESLPAWTTRLWSPGPEVTAAICVGQGAQAIVTRAFEEILTVTPCQQ